MLPTSTPETAPSLANVGTATTISGCLFARPMRPALTYGERVVTARWKYIRSDRRPGLFSPCRSVARTKPRRSIHPIPPLKRPILRGSSWLKYAFIAGTSPRTTGGAFAIAPSVAICPEKEVSIAAPTVPTRARRSRIARRLLSSYCRHATAIATAARRSTATRAAAIRRRRDDVESRSSSSSGPGCPRTRPRRNQRRRDPDVPLADTGAPLPVMA
jgi:hypothetical protein